LLLGENWNAQSHFLQALLSKIFVQFFPGMELLAARLPSLIGLGLFLWGIWRIGKQFPRGASRVLITLALLSNAYILDFFSLARGYGLALGFTLLALSFLTQAAEAKSRGDETARGQAAASLWLASGAALSNMAFLYFYAGLFLIVVWLGRGKRVRVDGWINAVALGAFYLPRVLATRRQNLLYFGGEVGFIPDTVGSLVRSSFYGWPVSSGWVIGVSVVLVLLVCLLAYWSRSQRIPAGFALSLLSLFVAVMSIATHVLLNVRYLEERAALFFVPLVMLNLGVVAAGSRIRWQRLFLWGVLLALSVVGLTSVNLNRTLTWRKNADIRSVVLALRDIHQRTGEYVVLGLSDTTKWTIWYYAEHLLGLRPEEQWPYRRNYEWLMVYEWKPIQTQMGLPVQHPFIPSTTHLLLDEADAGWLATQMPGRHTRLKFYPDSGMALYVVNAPEHEGTATSPDGTTYAGEFRNGQPNGRGTLTFPDGRKYVGEFRNAQPIGQGTYSFPDGRKYAGMFAKAELSGQGTITWPNGRTYVGPISHGKPYGQGALTFPDGRKYTGEFANGEPNGRGTMTLPDGR